MTWMEVRRAHPGQWLVIEALEAHSERMRRSVDRLSVVEVCADGGVAFKRYCELHRQFPSRELYPVHTASEQLEIAERSWFEAGEGREAPTEG